MFVNLNDEVSSIISEKANEYIVKNKLSVPIGTQIFSELERVSILLLYPLFDENANGICVTRTVNNKKVKFIFINTNNYITKQVYTAAHEIGHIIDIDKEIKKTLEFDDDPELIINRFASELLMPKKIFIDEFLKIKKEIIGNKMKVDINDMNSIIFELMLYFMVPYRAICYRMGEVSILSSNNVILLERYERQQKDDIEKKLRSEKKYEKLVNTNREKKFAKIDELLKNAEDNNLTFKTKIDRMKEIFNEDNKEINDITIQELEV